MLNPLRWQHQRQLALVLAAIIGAVLGTAFWYLAFEAGTGAAGGVPFSQAFFSARYWFTGGAWWAIWGAGVGALCLYARELVSQ